MRRLLVPVLLTLTFVVVACATTQVGSTQTVFPATPVSAQSASSTAQDSNAPVDLKRVDQQGMVTFEVTPLNINNLSDQLEFNVAMNTHSIDLGMDLAKLATLTTDTRFTIQATSWDGMPGGHHVSGKLIFPATKDGKSILEGATKLTLTILDVDAPSRLFEWVLK
jgi:hypothetical protein